MAIVMEFSKAFLKYQFFTASRYAERLILPPSVILTQNTLNRGYMIKRISDRRITKIPMKSKGSLMICFNSSFDLLKYFLMSKKGHPYGVANSFL